MNGNRFLLDTNIILYILGGDEIIAHYLFDKILYTSIICEIELLSFKFITSKEEAEIKSFLKEFRIISIDQPVKDLAIILRKRYSLKIPDSIIAATSVNLGIPLVTSDKGLKSVSALQIDFYNKNL